MDPTIGIWLKNDGIETKIIDIGADLVNFVILRGFQSKIVKFNKLNEMRCDKDKKNPFETNNFKTKKIEKRRF